MLLCAAIINGIVVISGQRLVRGLNKSSYLSFQEKSLLVWGKSLYAG